MGISIRALNPDGPPPRGTEVTLTCDNGTCTGADVFELQYIGAHGAAMILGWLERSGPQGRLWLCPACSGKRP